MERAANVNGAASAQQRVLLEQVRQQFAPPQGPKGTWA
jgi:hypothetical protein